MEYFPIRSFRPFENKTESTDQDRTVLRLCDGFLPVPIGALSSGPRFAPMWGVTDLQATCLSVLQGADTTKAHFVKITRGNHVLLVVWSLAINQALAIFHVTAGTLTEFDFSASSGTAAASPANATYRDKDGSARWFASRIGARWYFGNGVDDNLQWKDAALSKLGPAVALNSSDDIYNPSRVKIPPCTTFVMNGTRSVFAAGNASNPLRVWITNPPTSDFPFNEGIYSLTKSYIDVTYSEATRITALSAFQNYITAHTDAKPVNLFDVDGTNDGWKCVQASGAANASAPTPACVRDTNGMASFYLGADGEVYKDEAVRVGPNDKRPSRDQDIATAQQSGAWSRDMTKPVARAHTVYDRKTAMFWMFAELSSFPGHMGLWAFYERSRSVAGPIRYPNAVCSTVLGGVPDATVVAVVTPANELLFANLSTVGETEEFLAEASSSVLGSDYAEVASAPTVTPGMSFVAMSADRQTIAEILPGGDFYANLIEDSDGMNLLNSRGVLLRSAPPSSIKTAMATPWSPFVPGGSQTFATYYKDAYVARFETAYLDLGTAQLRKNFLELRTVWQKKSRAYIGLYAETEDGRSAGKWRGLVFGKEEHRVPLNLFGCRIRVRCVAVVFNGSPALLREITIGFLPAGTT